VSSVVVLYIRCIFKPKVKKRCLRCIEKVIVAIVLEAHHEKCIRQPVQIVGKNVKFHLNQMVQDLFTARTVIRIIGQKDFR
jgi:hypothetical protein